MLALASSLKSVAVSFLQSMSLYNQLQQAALQVALQYGDGDADGDDDFGATVDVRACTSVCELACHLRCLAVLVLQRLRHGSCETSLLPALAQRWMLWLKFVIVHGAVWLHAVASMLLSSVGAGGWCGTRSSS